MQVMTSVFIVRKRLEYVEFAMFLGIPLTSVVNELLINPESTFWYTPSFIRRQEILTRAMRESSSIFAGTHTQLLHFKLKNSEERWLFTMWIDCNEKMPVDMEVVIVLYLGCWPGRGNSGVIDIYAVGGKWFNIPQGAM